MNRLLSLPQLAFFATALSILGLCLTASAAPLAPFQGRGDLVVTGAEELPPASRRLTASATGQATHLGRFTRTETLIVNLADGAFTGTLEFTAANGRPAPRRRGGTLHFTDRRFGRGDVPVHGWNWSVPECLGTGRV